MKVTVVGGGSTYTPEIAFELLEEGAPRVERLTLHDVDAERLGVVAGFVRRVLAAHGSAVEVEETLNLDAALEGARFVLVQIRVGGSAGRVRDETIPPRHGVIGQETTGPGGFAMALRAVPAATEIAERACALAPGAHLINFANPAGLVAEAILRTGARAVGLCNIPLIQQRAFEGEFGASEVHSFGLNHLSWIRGLAAGGRDRLPEVLARFPDEGELPRRLVEAIGMLPNPYLRYYYAHGRMLEQQRAAPRTRAEEVVEIERALLERYRDPDLVERPAELSRRGGALYSVAAMDFVRAVVGDSGERQVLNVPNRGVLDGLPDDAVVEVPCRVGAEGATPLPLEPMPEHAAGLVRAVKAYERLTIEAALSGSRRTALLALLSHPLVGRLEVAEPLLDELLAAHAEHLPRFAG